MCKFHVFFQTYRGTRRPSTPYTALVGSPWEDHLLQNCRERENWVDVGTYEAEESADACQQAFDKYTYIDEEGYMQWLPE